ncbi:MAG TPA: lipoyl(octanoyl) transferase LipB [Candidatus Macondimonas sp.]|nr:lipoyl(octanoyl) transferase LipB [Candidatus Macondimonas sp.]
MGDLTPPPEVRDWGLAPYPLVWEAMRQYTDQRDTHTPDALWFVQHPPVYTLGMHARPEHVLAPRDIPVILSDRGGQVTYHGPGQWVVYPLLDLRRLGLGIRSLVNALEQAVIDLLAGYGIKAHARREAPGVYVDGAKIAALGLRVRRGCCYHGLALNVDMDLAPFAGINPCGYADLAVTQVRAFRADLSLAQVRADLESALRTTLRLPSP